MAEETGLTGLTPVAALGVRDRPHPVTGGPRRTTYVHLTAPPGPARRWTHRVGGGGGDDGLLFACRFTPLPLTAPLADDQDELLGAIDPAWTPPARR
ncbi:MULTISPECIES: hypothetical protein [unclassified Micromonospora]|uniref:hypothetical protein n=1 Tax=unclassified Micromonospora TaxID=2617518 RepID=UPI002FF3B7F6